MQDEFVLLNEFVKTLIVEFQLCKTVIRTFNPTSRADYLWYLQFTFTVLLLKDLPVPLYALQGDLLTNCFDPITSCWDQNPIKVQALRYDT